MSDTASSKAKQSRWTENPSDARALMRALNRKDDQVTVGTVTLKIDTYRPNVVIKKK